MATRKELWECDKCETLHPTESEAKECEENHTFADKMEVIEVSQCTQDFRYPDRILVSDGSGDAAEYELRGEHSYEEYYNKGDYYFEWNAHKDKDND